MVKKQLEVSLVLFTIELEHQKANINYSVMNGYVVYSGEDVTNINICKIEDVEGIEIYDDYIILNLKQDEDNCIVLSSSGPEM